MVYEGSLGRLQVNLYIHVTNANLQRRGHTRPTLALVPPAALVNVTPKSDRRYEQHRC